MTTLASCRGSWPQSTPSLPLRRLWQPHF
jgi:hypothetical protein